MHTLLRRIVSCVPALTGRRTSSPQTWGAGGAFLALCLAAFLLPAPARAAGYTLHTLHTFSAVDGNGYNADGAHSDGNVTLDGMGHLYGTTYDGGTSGLGTLFEVDLATNTFTTLVNFNGSNGANPNAGVTLDGQGHLYGTTYSGGSGGYGTVFKVNLATKALTTLVTFNNSNGAGPYAGVMLDGSGNLYGTTSFGGSGGYGTIYKINLATKGLTTLVSFNGSNGAYPVAGVTLDGTGKLYGTTYYGGSSGNNGKGYGIVYKVSLATHSLTTLVTFNGNTGANPSGDVALDGNGFLYGTTRAGGSGHDGTVYKLNLATKTFTTLVTFNGNSGATPYGGVTLDGNGFLYGTTEAGGGSNDGTVFKVNLATKALTTLVTFNGSNAANPNAGITLDDSGNLYGATDQGGTHNNGTVYELTPNP